MTAPGSAVPAEFEFLSVVVPVRDEEASIDGLLHELDAALAGLGLELEWVFVDDASADGTRVCLQAWLEKDPRLRVLSLPQWSGQSTALDVGLRAARGDVVAILDGDGQNDPADLPALLAGLATADVVSGVRQGRRDPWSRRVASRVANGVRRAILRDDVTDIGCSLRVVRAHWLRRIKLYRGMHRFLPILLSIEGARLAERPVHHRPRTAGRSKYGVGNRFFPALLDLLAVAWMQRRAIRVEAARDEGPAA